MQDQIREQKEIVEHYKTSLNQGPQSDPNQELREMIKAKEDQISKLDNLLKMQAKDNQPVSFPSPFTK